jgi:hypothetical protein
MFRVLWYIQRPNPLDKKSILQVDLNVMPEKLRPYNIQSSGDSEWWTGNNVKRSGTILAGPEVDVPLSSHLEPQIAL